MFARLCLCFFIVLFWGGSAGLVKAEEEEEEVVKVGRIDKYIGDGKGGFGTYLFSEDNGSQCLVFTSIFNLARKKGGGLSSRILKQATSEDMLKKDLYERMSIKLRLEPISHQELPDEETGLWTYNINKVEKKY